MQQRTHPDNTHEQTEVPRHARQPYVAPTLEPLGNWKVLTLQQSVGIALFHDNPFDMWSRPW